MKLDAVQDLALELMTAHGLIAAGTRFEFDNARVRAGACHWRSIRIGEWKAEKITLSRRLMALWDEADVRDTILHEIAHALAGHDAHHGPRWKQIAASIGAKPERCYSAADKPAVPMPWVGVCPTCGKEYGRTRRPTRVSACSRCCGRRFDPQHTLTWMTRAQFEATRQAPVTVVAAQTPPRPAGVVPSEQGTLF